MSALLRNNKLRKKFCLLFRYNVPSHRCLTKIIQRSQRDLYEKRTVIPYIRVPEQASWSRITLYWDCTSCLAGQHFGFKSAYWFSDNLHETSNWAGTRDEPLRTSAGEGNKSSSPPSKPLKYSNTFCSLLQQKSLAPWTTSPVGKVTGEKNIILLYLLLFFPSCGRGGGWV